MKPMTRRHPPATGGPERGLAALDRILMSDEELMPSSGFAAAVMERVRKEAAAPAPLAFPWKRALPAGAIGALFLGWSLVELVRALRAAEAGLAAAAPSFAWPAQVLLPALWVALALAAPFLTQRIARGIAGDSGLF